MLSSLRNQSKSIVVKVLLVLLVVSFGAWGITDYISGGHGPQGAVATVGDTEITAYEYSAEYRREFLRLRQVFGNNLIPEGARAFGIPMTVAQRMVQEEVLYQRAREAGLSTSDALVLETIRSMEQFTGLTGSFDEQVFIETIGRAGFSQAGFVERVRRDIAREAFMNGLMAEPVVPDALAERLFRFNEETRDIVIAAIPEDAIPAAEVPDADAVAAYFEENQASFRAPAFRSITYVNIGPDTVSDEITVTDEEIAISYDERAGEFAANATRDVSQIVFDSEADAATAFQRINAGESYDAVAEEMAGLSESDTRLGVIDRSGLPFEELVDPIFAAATGDIVGPVQSVLGWHVFRINDSQEQAIQPLAEVRDQLIEDLRAERALDLVFDLANRVDEMIGEGSTLEEIADALNLPLSSIDAVDADGTGPDGLRVDGPQDPTLGPTVFEEEIGVASPLIETESGYYVFRVNEETPARPKVLDEVREDVIANLMDERREENARRVADELKRSVGGAGSLESAANSLGATVERHTAIKRNGDGLDNAGTYRDALPVLFEASDGETVVVRLASGFAVAVVSNVTSPDPASDAESMAILEDQLRGDLRADFSDLLIRGLAERFNAQIDVEAIEREAL